MRGLAVVSCFEPTKAFAHRELGSKAQGLTVLGRRCAFWRRWDLDLEGWGGALVGVGFTGMLYCFPKRIEVLGIRLRESWSGFGAPFVKSEEQEKGTLIIEGSLGNLIDSGGVLPTVQVLRRFKSIYRKA